MSNIVPDAQPEDAYDPTGITDYDAVARRLSSEASRLLARAGGAENERALALVRVIVLNVVLRSIGRLAEFIQHLGDEQDASDEWRALTVEQREQATILIALIVLWLAREGSIS